MNVQQICRYLLLRFGLTISERTVRNWIWYGRNGMRLVYPALPSNVDDFIRYVDLPIKRGRPWKRGRK